PGRPRVQDVKVEGWWLQVAGCRWLVAGCWLQVASSNLQACERRCDVQLRTPEPSKAVTLRLSQAPPTLGTLQTLQTLQTLRTLQTLQTSQTLQTLHTLQTLQTLQTPQTLQTLRTSLQLPSGMRHDQLRCRRQLTCMSTCRPPVSWMARSSHSSDRRKSSFGAGSRSEKWMK